VVINGIQRPNTHDQPLTLNIIERSDAMRGKIKGRSKGLTKLLKIAKNFQGNARIWS